MFLRKPRLCRQKQTCTMYGLAAAKKDSNMKPKRRRCFPAVNHDQQTQNLSPSTSKQPSNPSTQQKPSDIYQPTDTI
jgi:hypothetical protein